MRELSDYERGLIANVENHGWQATKVFDPEGNDPNFCYSVGFSKTLGAPEVIIFGLDLQLMHNMLWEVFRQLKAGATLEHGKRWKDLLEGFDCVSKKANHPELFTEYAVSADWFWSHQGNDGHPEVYQMFWPGAQQGLFPWEPNCDAFVIQQQSALL